MFEYLAKGSRPLQSGAPLPWEQVGNKLRYVKAADFEGVIMPTQFWHDRNEKSAWDGIEWRLGHGADLHKE